MIWLLSRYGHDAIQPCFNSVDQINQPARAVVLRHFHGIRQSPFVANQTDGWSLDGVGSFSPDWQNRIRTGQSLIPGLPVLDGVAAQRAIDVFDCS